MNKVYFLFFTYISIGSLHNSKFLSSQAILINVHKMQLVTENIVNADTVGTSPEQTYKPKVISNHPLYDYKRKIVFPQIKVAQRKDFIEEEHNILGKIYKPNVSPQEEIVHFQEISAHQDILLRSYDLTNAMMDKAMDLIRS